MTQDTKQESNRSFSKFLLPPVYLLSSLCLITPSSADELGINALPSNPLTLIGDASFSTTSNTLTTGSTLTIDTASNVTGISWDSFNVGAQNTVVFNQPSSDSTTVNIIKNPSEIHGNVSSNANLWFYAPQGIYIGDGAVFDIRGLYLSTSAGPATGDIAKAVEAGIAMLEDTQSNGTISINNANFKIGDNGYFAINANHTQITNSSISGITPITVQIGGQDVKTIALDEDGMLKLKLPENMQNNVQENTSPKSILISNSDIKAPGGSVTIAQNRGLIVTEDTYISVAATEGQEKGGNIDIYGQDATILIGDNTHFDLSGPNGGNIRIGGSFSPQIMKDFDLDSDKFTTLPLASIVSINAGASINVSGYGNEKNLQADAGTVAINSEDQTNFAGTITGTSGKKGENYYGNGAKVEVSSKKSLSVGDEAKINVESINGENGMVALDPENIYIVGSTNNNAPNFVSSDSTTINIPSKSIGFAQQPFSTTQVPVATITVAGGSTFASTISSLSVGQTIRISDNDYVITDIDPADYILSTNPSLSLPEFTSLPVYAVQVPSLTSSLDSTITANTPSGVTSPAYSSVNGYNTLTFDGNSYLTSSPTSPSMPVAGVDETIYAVLSPGNIPVNNVGTGISHGTSGTSRSFGLKAEAFGVGTRLYPTATDFDGTTVTSTNPLGSSTSYQLLTADYHTSNDQTTVTFGVNGASSFSQQFTNTANPTITDQGLYIGSSPTSSTTPSSPWIGGIASVLIGKNLNQFEKDALTGYFLSNPTINGLSAGALSQLSAFSTGTLAALSPGAPITLTATDKITLDPKGSTISAQDSLSLSAHELESLSSGTISAQTLTFTGTGSDKGSLPASPTSTFDATGIAINLSGVNDVLNIQVGTQAVVDSITTVNSYSLGYSSLRFGFTGNAGRFQVNPNAQIFAIALYVTGSKNLDINVDNTASVDISDIFATSTEGSVTLGDVAFKGSITPPTYITIQAAEKAEIGTVTLTDPSPGRVIFLSPQLNIRPDAVLDVRSIYLSGNNAQNIILTAGEGVTFEDSVSDLYLDAGADYSATIANSNLNLNQAVLNIDGDSISTETSSITTSANAILNPVTSIILGSVNAGNVVINSDNLDTILLGENAQIITNNFIIPPTVSSIIGSTGAQITIPGNINFNNADPIANIMLSNIKLRSTNSDVVLTNADTLNISGSQIMSNRAATLEAANTLDTTGSDVIAPNYAILTSDQIMVGSVNTNYLELTSTDATNGFIGLAQDSVITAEYMSISNADYDNIKIVSPYNGKIQGNNTGTTVDIQSDETVTLNGVISLTATNKSAEHILSIQADTISLEEGSAIINGGVSSSAPSEPAPVSRVNALLATVGKSLPPSLLPQSGNRANWIINLDADNINFGGSAHKPDATKAFAIDMEGNTINLAGTIYSEKDSTAIYGSNITIAPDTIIGSEGNLTINQTSTSGTNADISAGVGSTLAAHGSISINNEQGNIQLAHVLANNSGSTITIDTPNDLTILPNSQVKSMEGDISISSGSIAASGSSIDTLKGDINIVSTGDVTIGNVNNQDSTNSPYSTIGASLTQNADHDGIKIDATGNILIDSISSRYSGVSASSSSGSITLSKLTSYNTFSLTAPKGVIFTNESTIVTYGTGPFHFDLDNVSLNSVKSWTFPDLRMDNESLNVISQQSETPNEIGNTTMTITDFFDPDIDKTMLTIKGNTQQALFKF